MPLKTTIYDPAEFLGSLEAQAEFLADAFETDDASYVANALGVIARARGMTHVARDAGVTREALYRALSAEGDPKLSTVMAVARALGMHLAAAVAPAAPDQPDPSAAIARRIAGHAAKKLGVSKKAPARKAAPKRPPAKKRVASKPRPAARLRPKARSRTEPRVT